MQSIVPRTVTDLLGRLVRLIPSNQSAIYALLNHRLSRSREQAYSDWQDIVAGTSPLWTPISPDTRELLRSMLNHVNFEIIKRARPPVSTFNFSSASVGNLFLTGARLFTGSFESAIHLLALICGILPEKMEVVPAINSNFSHHISAGLYDGTVITGQNAISHPSEPAAFPSDNQISLASMQDSSSSSSHSVQSSSKHGRCNPSTLIEMDDASAEDANLPGSLHVLRKAEINFSKSPDTEESLTSRIERIWYINPYGQEMSPAANPKAVSVIKSAEALVYSIGSLYTSIVPCLILRGIGEAIVSSVGVKQKILIVNGSNDRETGPKADPMDAVDFVAAIARAGEESRGYRNGIPSVNIWKKYITHLIYLEGDGAPKVDRTALNAAGVDCIRCWGRKADDGSWRYNANSLLGALEAILGRGDKSRDRSRRNTMEK